MSSQSSAFPMPILFPCLCSSGLLPAVPILHFRAPQMRPWFISTFSWLFCASVLSAIALWPSRLLAPISLCPRVISKGDLAVRSSSRCVYGPLTTVCCTYTNTSLHRLLVPYICPSYPFCYPTAFSCSYLVIGASSRYDSRARYQEPHLTSLTAALY